MSPADGQCHSSRVARRSRTSTETGDEHGSRCLPIVWSTVDVKYGINGPTRKAIADELPGVEVIDRTSMNAFEDVAFRDAVKKTGRKRLIDKARGVINWYFAEIPKVTSEVGV
jgi:hypothetical protein